MKKSEIYGLAMKAVIDSPRIATEDKIAIIRELIEKESIELYREQQEAEKREEEF